MAQQREQMMVGGRVVPGPPVMPGIQPRIALPQAAPPPVQPQEAPLPVQALEWLQGLWRDTEEGVEGLVTKASEFLVPAFKAKIAQDMQVIQAVAEKSKDVAQSVYQFGKDVVTDAADMSLPKAGQALSNFASGVTGDESVPFGESGPLSRLASGAGFAAGMMIPGEAEIAGARRIGRGLYSRLDDAFKLIPDKAHAPQCDHEPVQEGTRWRLHRGDGVSWRA
jgi:hypothetical protein